MEISGDYTFDAPQSLVWEAVLDPNVLGAIMPGGQGIEAVGENAYRGSLQIKVGPVQGTFQGDIKLSEIVPPESYLIAVEGKGAPGFVSANGHLHLEARGAQTYLTYAGQAQIGGRIASVGQRLIDSSARSIIRHSLDALNEYLKVKVAEQAAAQPLMEAAPSHYEAVQPAVPVSAYRPPSQLEMMLKVAHDVMGELVPAQYRSVVAGAVLVLVVLLLWYFASQQ
jgi:hypothetical protein